MLTFINCHCQYNISSPRKDLLIPLFLHAKTSFQSYFSAVKACGKPSCETLFIIIIFFLIEKQLQSPFSVVKPLLLLTDLTHHLNCIAKTSCYCIRNVLQMWIIPLLWKKIVAKQQFSLMLSPAWVLVINLQDRTITGICIFMSTNILIFWASQSCVCLLFSPPQGFRRTSWLLLPFFQNKAR